MTAIVTRCCINVRKSLLYLSNHCALTAQAIHLVSVLLNKRASRGAYPLVVHCVPLLHLVLYSIAAALVVSEIVLQVGFIPAYWPTPSSAGKMQKLE